VAPYSMGVAPAASRAELKPISSLSTSAPMARDWQCTLRSNGRSTISGRGKLSLTRVALPAGLIPLRDPELYLHQEFVTVLVCGRELKADSRSNNFDKIVCHDDICDRIEFYPDRE
jgi:hypothetical protein